MKFKYIELEKTVKDDYKEFFLNGQSSLNLSINDHLDVLIQISSLHEQQLFTELNHSFRPKDMPILQKLLPLLNKQEMFRTDIKMKIALKFAMLMKIKTDHEKELAEQIKSQMDELTYETKEIINKMSSGFRNGLLHALEHSKGSIIYI